MTISIDDIKRLRAETEAPVLEVKKALENAGGDYKKAKEYLVVWSKERAAKKSGEVASVGIVETYIHTGSKVGAMIVLYCQTDFVARTENFKKLAHEIVMQVASMDPKDVSELLEQTYIRDPKKKIKDLVNEQIAKLGENIKVAKISRFSV